jgi:hypothetical protein
LNYAIIDVPITMSGTKARSATDVSSNVRKIYGEKFPAAKSKSKWFVFGDLFLHEQNEIHIELLNCQFSNALELTGEFNKNWDKKTFTERHDTFINYLIAIFVGIISSVINHSLLNTHIIVSTEFVLPIETFIKFVLLMDKIFPTIESLTHKNYSFMKLFHNLMKFVFVTFSINSLNGIEPDTSMKQIIKEFRSEMEKKVKNPEFELQLFIDLVKFIRSTSKYMHLNGLTKSQIDEITEIIEKDLVELTGKSSTDKIFNVFEKTLTKVRGRGINIENLYILFGKTMPKPSAVFRQPKPQQTRNIEPSETKSSRTESSKPKLSRSESSGSESFRFLTEEQQSEEMKNMLGKFVSKVNLGYPLPESHSASSKPVLSSGQTQKPRASLFQVSDDCSTTSGALDNYADHETEVEETEVEEVEEVEVEEVEETEEFEETEETEVEYEQEEDTFEEDPRFSEHREILKEINSLKTVNALFEILNSVVHSFMAATEDFGSMLLYCLICSTSIQSYFGSNNCLRDELKKWFRKSFEGYNNVDDFIAHMQRTEGKTEIRKVCDYLVRKPKEDLEDIFGNNLHKIKQNLLSYLFYETIFCKFDGMQSSYSCESYIRTLIESNYEINYSEMFNI